MKKFLFRFVPILVCCIVLVAPFSVSASSFPSFGYDVLANCSNVQYTLDGFTWTNLDSFSLTFGTGISSSIRFRFYCDVPSTFDSINVSFYSTSGTDIVSADLFHRYSPPASAFNITDSGNFWNLNSLVYNITENNVEFINSIVYEGYIEYCINFIQEPNSCYLAFNQFYLFSNDVYSITSALNAKQQTMVFDEINNKFAPTLEVNTFTYNIGSTLLRNTPTSSHAGMLYDSLFLDITDNKLPFSNPQYMFVSISSCGDSAVNLDVYNSSGKYIYTLSPVNSETTSLPKHFTVVDNYGTWGLSCLFDVSGINFTEGNYLQLHIETNICEGSQSFYSSILVNGIYILPFQSEPNFFMKIIGTIKDGFNSVVNAIRNIFPDSSSGEEFLNDAVDKRNELDNAMNQIDSVQKPDISNSGDISSIVSPSVSTSYGNIFTSVIGNDYVVNILLLMGTFMLAGYVLFGKK